MKIGDYVRTKSGKIYKITDFKKYYINGKLIIEKQLVYIDNRNSCLNYEQFCKLIIKNSPNIIDLISYGDIVKYKIDDEIFISEVWGEKNDYFIQNFNFPIDLRDLDIISVLTKEQFESMEYKIGD